MTIPAASDYPSFFAGYIGLVPETDIVSVLSSQVDLVPRLSAAVGADRELYAYEPSKWTIRQVMGHLVDAERVFSFRALCFSRAEQQPLPGFSENVYVDRSRFNDRPLGDMADEFALVRRANVKMFAALDTGQWATDGYPTASRLRSAHSPT